MATNAPHVHPGPGTPGLPITSLETPARSRSPEANKDPNFASQGRERSRLSGPQREPISGLEGGVRGQCSLQDIGGRAPEAGPSLHPLGCHRTPAREFLPQRPRELGCGRQQQAKNPAPRTQAPAVHDPPTPPQQNLRRPPLDSAVHPAWRGARPAWRGALTSETLGGLRGNFPSRGQPAAAPPRLGPAPGAAGRPSRVPKSTALAQKLRQPRDPHRPLPVPPLSQPPPSPSPAPAPAPAAHWLLRVPIGASGEPKAQARRGLKGTRGLYCTTGWSSLPEHINLFAERPHLTME
ncbi:basic proline-rich protein-like [Pongo pygmaeus]|uniref:basic proline-rich protein-like n=1 Tax=Pongo pygmaeus TaxID=9600 RepID=UPI0023E220A6|nr:basic proline-rich protein-like [Pongo pygmaeus]